VHEISRLTGLHEGTDNFPYCRQLFVIRSGDFAPLSAMEVTTAPAWTLLDMRRRRKRYLRAPALHGVQRCR
jgi:hypothetical protein